MGDFDNAQEPGQGHDNHAASAGAVKADGDARALLDRLASAKELTPSTVATLLHNCANERVRKAILAEVGARWGNSGVQQTLAAERQLTQHAASPNASTGAHGPGRTGHAANQDGTHSPSVPAATDADWSAAQTALQVAADVVQHERQQMIPQAPARYAPSLSLLYSAVTGRGQGGKLSGADRIRVFKEAKAGLEPAIALYASSDDGRAWLDDQLLHQLDSLQSSLQYSEAKARVDGSVRIGKDAVMEVADDKHPREQGAQLHAELKKLIPTIGMINEQVIRLKHDGIHHEAEALMEGHAHGKKLGPGSLVELQTVLWMVDGFLTLTDEELAHHLREVHGVFNGVSTYSELVKAVAELTGGAISLTASYAAAIAKLAGDSSSAAMATGLARSTGLLFANVIAGIEIIHGVAVLLDPHATPQEKVDGAVGASSGAAWFIGSRVGGAAVGFAASSAILLGYAELKLMAHLYWEANVGLTAGFMKLAYETIQRDGESIARSADDLAKAGLLRQEEKDPAKAAALQRVETTLTAQLGAAVDYFIDDCKPHGFEAGVARYPGAYTILREVFAPVMKHKGSKTPEAVTEAARVALERITWSMAHASELVLASAKQQSLADVEHAQEKKEHGGEE